jgi:hypothetical protein
MHRHAGENWHPGKKFWIPTCVGMTVNRSALL